MPAGLDAYLAQVTPPAFNRWKLSVRRQKIEEALATSPLKVVNMWEAGSFHHDTAVAGHSDIDYLVSSATLKPIYPERILRTLKSALEGLDYSIRDVRIAGPGVRVSYYDPPHFYLAPGLIRAERNGYATYDIPGRRDDEWVVAAPVAHSEYISRVDGARGHRVRPLIRLVKAWKYSRRAPVSSFYLEMRTVQFAEAVSPATLQIDLRNVFAFMLAADLGDIDDPIGVVGRIPGCMNDKDEVAVRQMMHEAVAHLKRAERAIDDRDWIDYWMAMRDVFEDFPYADG